MPEGPEVAYYYHKIKDVLEHQNLQSIEILSGRYLKRVPDNWNVLEKQLPQRLVSLFVKGKSMFIQFENKYGIVITHGMTGYWSFEESKHSRFRFKTDNGIIYFDDIRSFGTISACDPMQFQHRIEKLGPNILDDNLSYEKFWERLKCKKNSKIGIALLNQNLLAGVGNYLRCDILWHAKINGESKIKELSEKQMYTIYQSTVGIARYHSGMSYTLATTPEDFDRDFFVYMQETDPYGKIVHTKQLGSRTFHYICQ